MPKIVHLPGINMNPLALLGEVLERKPDAVVTLSRVDNEWRVGWSNMTVQELVYATHFLRVKVDELVLNGGEE